MMTTKIAVLFGARVQRGLARESAKVLTEELRARGHTAWIVRVDDEPWQVELEGGDRSVDRERFAFELEDGSVPFGFAFLAIHDDIGKGPIQGYLDLLGVPYDSSGQLASLVCDDKFATRTWLGARGVPLAEGLLYRRAAPIPERELIARLGLPCFVKPNRGGSAVGSAKVSRAEELGPALAEALRWDDAVVVESFIPGRELTCGVVARGGEVIALPLTEYLLDGGCKTWELNQGTVPKQTPADLSEAAARRIRDVAVDAYRALGCRGLVRVDFRLDERRDHAPVLLEVNTLPGLERRGAMLTQVVAAGLDVGDLFEGLMVDSLAEHAARQRPGTGR